MRRRTSLDAAGHGQRPPGTESACRLIAIATAGRNGRAQRSPSVQVPDPAACAVEARRQRALLRMIDPLLDAEGGSAVDASGDMAMETAAFDHLPVSQQLPSHPPLWALLRCEDRAGAQAQLSRFGGKRGSFRAMPVYKELALELLRPSEEEEAAAPPPENEQLEAEAADDTAANANKWRSSVARGTHTRFTCASDED